MSSIKMYSRVRQTIRNSKRVADMVEALIGAYLNSCGEVASLSFMKWLGLHIDFVDAPMLRHFPVNAKKLVNVWYFESLLHYKFHDPSLLVEALTQGSYAGLHKHLLHASPNLQRQICCTVQDFEKLDLVSIFGWEAETTFPKVFDKDTNTFLSIRPLLELLITPQTIKLQSIRELSELCAHKCYLKKKSVSS
ncbi:hypothetical protein R3W88_000461 [Solanum pinnatisectum]|uniref:Uncharacterized protein n=1 Tax=Solanum pinnatisectum TaxID=50273 RepID=A0AAV9MFM0_9SOLN|nr:hypothetical protein R3W88_000461 [Solanum pinnatisectum]